MKRTVTALLTVAALILGATPAAATAWGTLRAYRDGNLVASGYGDYYKSGLYQRMKATYRDERGDNYGAYVEVAHYYDRGTGWLYLETDSTTRIGTAGSPRTEYEDAPLQSSGFRARGEIHVCIDVPLSLDNCSQFTYPQFSY